MSGVSELDLSLVLGRVNAIDSDVREIRQEMQQTVMSVNGLRGAVDGMTDKLETLISATSSIEGQRGMVPVTSIRWVVGTGVAITGLMLTVATIISAMILHQVDSRDEMVRRDVKIEIQGELLADHKSDLELARSKLAAREAEIASKESELRFRMSANREASVFGAPHN